MIFVLYCTETDNATYSFSKEIFFEDESLESLYVKLSDIHDSKIKEFNIKKHTDEYHKFDVKIGEEYIKLSDINDDMNIVSFEDYIEQIKKETIKI